MGNAGKSHEGRKCHGMKNDKILIKIKT